MFFDHAWLNTVKNLASVVPNKCIPGKCPTKYIAIFIDDKIPCAYCYPVTESILPLLEERNRPPLDPQELFCLLDDVGIYSFSMQANRST
jgi:hypothetical protein